MEVKHVIVGKTGRAQLVVKDYTAESIPLRHRKEKPEFQVYLLPRYANRNTSYASAGDPAYYGSDLEVAMMHVKAWTSLAEVELPSVIKKYGNS